MINYKNDLQDGPYVAYHENGKIGKSGSYKYNNPNGKWSFYNESGQLTEVQIWDNGNKISTRFY